MSKQQAIEALSNTETAADLMLVLEAISELFWSIISELAGIVNRGDWQSLRDTYKNGGECCQAVDSLGVLMLWSPPGRAPVINKYLLSNLQTFHRPRDIL